MNAPTPSQPQSDTPTTKAGSARSLNQTIARRQKWLLGTVSAALIATGSWFILGDSMVSQDDEETQTEQIDTTGLVNTDLSQREFVASYSNRLEAIARDQKELREAQMASPALQAQIDALSAENAQMRLNGQQAIDAMGQENAALRAEIERGLAQASQNLPPAPLMGAGFDNAVPTSAPATAEPVTPPDQPKIEHMAFSPPQRSEPSTVAASGPITQTPDNGREHHASKDYLPPNSYAPARVIVGVDASTGVSSQSDPLPVVFRITGPARSAMRGNKLLTTDLTGCLVNGAARGDLSSEKVYVKLARMTCAERGGGYAVSEVKGFISFAGKSGVRGRVVSREGNLVSQALLAGIIGGFGRGLSANTSGLFDQIANPDGTRKPLSAGDILTGGLGQGGASAADSVSQYLIERAEQYQPVVEMPTGIEVEIIFLDGVQVRNP